MPNPPPILSVAEAAQQTSIPRRTIRYAILRGSLPAHKMPGDTGAYVIQQRDLDQWMAEREAKTA